MRKFGLNPARLLKLYLRRILEESSKPTNPMSLPGFNESPQEIAVDLFESGILKTENYSQL